MNNTDLEFANQWQASLELGLREFSLSPDENRVQVFHADISEKGRLEYCIQANDWFISLQDQAVTRCKQKVLYFPLGEKKSEITSYLKARGSRLRLIEKGEERWVAFLATGHFGFGMGRNEEDRVEFDSYYLGSYWAKLSIIAVKPVFETESGGLLLAVMMNNGLLYLLDFNGKILYQQKIMKGSFDKAVIIDCSENGQQQLIISIYRQYKRKRIIGWDIDYEWHSFLLRYQNNRLQQHCYLKETGILAPIPGRHNEFFDHRMRPVILTGSVLEKTRDDSDFGFGPLDSKTLLQDPRDPSRVCKLSIDQGQNSFALLNATDAELWSQALDVAGTVKNVVAGIGSAGTAAEDMLALWIETSNRLQGYAAENTEYHIRVFYKDGILIKKYDYPKDTESMSAAQLILDDINQDGNPELLVLNRQSLNVFELGEIAIDHEYLLSANPEVGNFPAYPLPPENLWD